MSRHDGPAAAGGPLLEVRDLQMHFKPRNASRGRDRLVRALDGVSFSVNPGETFAIVGESGSGKSTLARSVLRLVEPTGGEVRFHGRDILKVGTRELRSTRRQIQMVFQDPYASLHPLQTTEQIISEPWRVHSGVVPAKQRASRVRELLEQVGLPTSYARQYPARMSGGERQRIAIARALALQPEVLILDEPVSALDVSIQAQVIKLLMSLQQDLGLAYIFVSHDLALVRLIADRVGVMYKGKFVEIGTSESLYSAPSHPYTRDLLAAAPSMDADLAEVGPATIAISPLAANSSANSGCPYRDRCWRREEICDTDAPPLVEHDDVDHPVACHFATSVRSTTRELSI